jgi:hypothetical protein
MPDGNGFGNVSIANYLACLPPELQYSPIRNVTARLGGLAVVLSEDVCLGL